MCTVRIEPQNPCGSAMSRQDPGRVLDTRWYLHEELNQFWRRLSDLIDEGREEEVLYEISPCLI